MKDYEFYVPTITCLSCKGSIDNVLQKAKGIHAWTVDVTGQRVRVKADDHIHPEKVSELIEGIGHEATLITEKESQIFNFGVTGIVLTTQDCNQIEKAMSHRENWPDIQSCSVNYATNVVRIKMVSPIRDPERLNAVQIRLQKSIQSAIEKKIYVDIIPSPLSEERGGSVRHFRKALIHLGVFLLFIGGGSLLPLPVMGVITLGSMWLTAKETYIDAYKEAKRWSANMNTLIALGTITAFFSSLLAISQSFAAIPMILGIIKLGKAAKLRAQEATVKEIKSSYQLKLDMLPYDAIKLDPTLSNQLTNPNAIKKIIEKITQNIEQGNATVIKASEVKKGDLLFVRAGKRVPADGMVFCKEAFVEQEAITGESAACPLITENAVKCGSYVVSYPIIVQATSSGNESWLNKILSEVKDSASREPPHPALIDRFAKWFTPFILGVAILSGFGWLYLGGVAQAMQVMSAVLLCACPCMIGLGGPIAYASAIYKAFKEGVIVKNTAMLDAMGKIDTLFVDKTGTVTDLAIESVFIDSKNDKWNEINIVQYAATVQQSGTHQSFLEAFAKKNNSNRQSLLECNHFESNVSGVAGIVNGKRVIVGDETFLEQKNVKISQACLQEGNKYLEEKKTVTYIAVDDKCIAVVALKHVPRTGAKEMVEAMRERGIHVSMLTGDVEGAAKDIAQQIGIRLENVHYKLNPEEKASRVKEAKAQGKCVLVLGDGTNDQEAMKEADVAIAMGVSANAASSNEAGMIVTCLSQLTKIELIAKETLSTIGQNYSWTFAYNFFTLIAATGLLYPLTGIVLTPVMASTLMAISSLLIVLNTSRLPANIDIALGTRAPLSFWQHVKSFFSPSALCHMLAMLIGFELKEERVAQIKRSSPSPLPKLADPQPRGHLIEFESSRSVPEEPVFLSTSQRLQSRNQLRLH